MRKLRAIAKRAGRLTHPLKLSYGLGVAAAQLEAKVRRVNVVLLTSRGKALGLLRASWELTKTDISAGFCGKPMTLAQLRAKYGSGPRMVCRPIQRHGIVQGQKQQRGPDGALMFHPNGTPVNVAKIRLVDDSRRSLHNSHLIRTCETVAPCPFTYMAYVCEA